MRIIDFIEIGTSDFDTEIQNNDNRSGLSIDPVKFYLDRLPIKDNVEKLHMGISDSNRLTNVYYIPLDIIQQYNLPNWIRGCNTIGTYHPQVIDECNKRNINIEIISHNYPVTIKTLMTVMKEKYIDSIYYLKIDTEGHDTIILNKFAEEVIDNIALPHKILFESSIVLSTQSDITNTINIYIKKGYDVISSAWDTLLYLNLKKISNPISFYQMQNYYVKEYPIHYDINNLPHDNNLESAQTYCINHNHTCIVLENNIYSVRDGPYLIPTQDNIVSWIFL